MKAQEIQSPNKVEVPEGYISVFLAGSIEMGKAENWQERIVRELSDKPITFLNPRRDDWDSSWKQTIEDDQFRTQVEWELSSLESADAIIMYFDKETQSPISLLELGLFARSKKMFVCCPEGFWRKGNVDIVCKKYGVAQVDSIEGLIKKFKHYIK